MGRFDYAGRAQAVRLAQAELHAAFSEVVRRDDERDPRTRRWLAAIARFRQEHDLALPEDFDLFDCGLTSGDTLHSADIVEFLEADPIFFRSGYLKEKVLRCIRQRALEPDHVRRLQDVVIKMARTRDCREFRHYCRLAVQVDGDRLRAALHLIEASNDLDARRRAGWVLVALDKAAG